MDLVTSLHHQDRDLRSSSIPRLRQSSHRAKYGGPPPTDAFDFAIDPHASHPFPQFVELGKPRTDLTPRERFRVAQTSVGSLIGKRVNKHNQRTGERDPWYYWGPGKKWAMRQARGRDVDVDFGMRDLLEEIDASRDILEERWSSFNGGKDGVEENSGVLQAEESHLDAENAEGIVMALWDDEGEASTIDFTIRRRKRRDKRCKEPEDE